MGIWAIFSGLITLGVVFDCLYFRGGGGGGGWCIFINKNKKINKGKKWRAHDNKKYNKNTNNKLNK